MISIDYTITIGNLIEISTIALGGLLVLIRLNNNVVALQNDVKGIQSEVKKMNEIITKQAVQDQRILNLEQDIRDMRHGEGFVRSPTVPRGGIDGEYP